MAAKRPLKLNESLWDHRAGPVDVVLATEQRQRLAAALDALTDAELQLVTMRFGLAHHRPRSITYAARILRIPHHEAEAMLAETLAKIREAMT